MDGGKKGRRHRELGCFNKLVHQKSTGYEPWYEHARDINDCLSVLRSAAAHFASR